jgi:hypothetical protein
LKEKVDGPKDFVNADSDSSSYAATSLLPEDIARLAYALWEARGCGDRGADQDWFDAERELRAPRTKSQTFQDEAGRYQT